MDSGWVGIVQERDSAIGSERFIRRAQSFGGGGKLAVRSRNQGIDGKHAMPGQSLAA
jgi:hypothetical protein